MIGNPAQPLTWIGLPTDALGWGAGLCGILLLVPGVARRARRLVPAPWALPLLALLAALLSVLYFHARLGGQPRIIDASTYLLEARTFARGHFTFATAEASALFRGRFLLSPPGSPTSLGPIFPPGYPALLSLAVRLGDYRLLGPLLAILITLATAWLGLLVTGRRRVALLAALFSVLSAAVRYHTADTMSHGWSMLLTTLCLCAAVTIGKRRGSAPPWQGGRWFALPQALLGLSLGALFATRPLTALACALACALPSFASWFRLRSWPSFLLGLAPGLALFCAHNHALTGHVFGSPQLAYYALADGPLGCFHLGLGSGCRVEHGDVVAAQGGHGLTAGWMLLNTVHRLHWHALDLANCELLLPVAWYWLAKSWRRASTRSLSLLALLLPAAYALFYFQGSYPGGGARFFSELLPALHVALAAALAAFERTPVGIAAALLGYAGHAAHVHAALPGAPPLQTTLTAEGLPAVSSDHAFDLLFLPGRLERGQPPSVVRQTNDARRIAPGPAPIPLDLEAEADWPPLAQAGVWTERVHLADACVSGGRALRLHAATTGTPGQPWLELELTGVPAGRYDVTLWWWSAKYGCQPRALGEVHLPRRHQLFLAEFRGARPGEPLHLDRISLRPSP